MVWETETKTSRGQGQGEPWIARQSIPGLRISVHRHRDYPGEWLLTCTPELFNKHRLKSEELEDAKGEALASLKDKLAGMLYDVATMVEEEQSK